MKKYVNGKYIELTPEEITAMQKESTRAEMTEKSRPLTTDDLTRLFIAQNINTVITDDATASRAVEFHPVLRQDKVQTADTPLIRAGTRINWNGTLKRAAVDLWDTAANNPDNAHTLWEDIPYRNGIRIIPETITAGTYFTEGEYGWWGDTLYKSKLATNTYTPDQYPDGWEKVDV